MGRETLRTVGKILTDIAESKTPDTSVGNIVYEHVTESARNLIIILRCRGCTIARETEVKRSPKSPNKRLSVPEY